MSDLNPVSELGHPQDGGRGRGVCVDIKRGGWHLVETDQGATPAYVVLDKVTIQHVQGVLACHIVYFFTIQTFSPSVPFILSLSYQMKFLSPDCSKSTSHAPRLPSISVSRPSSHFPVGQYLANAARFEIF